MVELTAKEALNLLKADEERLNLLENEKASLLALLEEIRVAKESLNVLPEKEEEAMVPIGGTVLVPAKLGGKTVNVGVGAGVVLEESIEDAIKILEKRERRINLQLNEITDIQRKIRERDRKISEKLREFFKEQERTGEGVPVIG